MSQLANLPSITHRPVKRLGRGYGSGKGGHTSSRGQKGQRSRRGKGIPLWFEGGQLPLIKRLPMWRGKDRLSVVRPVNTITLAQLDRLPAGEVTIDTLRLHKLLSHRSTNCKIIANGTITKSLNLTGIKVSQAAQAQIVAAGGQVSLE